MGKMILDHLSMVLTSVRSGILSFNLEERRRRRQLARPRVADRGTWRSRGVWPKVSPLDVSCLRNWIPEVSYDRTEFRESPILLPISADINSLLMSRVLRRMFPYGST